LVVCELIDQEQLKSVIREHNVSGVTHYAASIEAGESMKVRERSFRNNTAKTLTVIETMLECGVTKMVFSSTAALYGTVRLSSKGESDRITRRSAVQIRPRNRERHCRNAVAFTCLQQLCSRMLFSDFTTQTSHERVYRQFCELQ
jgi:nucleoside-diphosphate-sugar epimerase